MYESVPHLNRRVIIGSCKGCPHYNEVEIKKNLHSICMAQHKVSVGYRDGDAWFEECPIWEETGGKTETDWKDAKLVRPIPNTMYLVRIESGDGYCLGYATGWYKLLELRWEVRMNFPLPVGYVVTHFAEFTFVEKEHVNG